VDWYKRRYNTELREEWIAYSDGSVTAINCAIETFTNAGDGVIIMRPVYGHFTGMVESDTHRKVASCHLVNRGGRYEIDWERFESLCKDPVNRAFLLCSPANPAGRVWSKEELSRIVEICRKNGVLVISDEIHSDIVRKGAAFHPIVSVTEDHSNIIMVTGINKSFNVAGLRCSNTVIPDDKLRGTFNKEFGGHQATPFAVAAVIAAYDESEDWLDELNAYLDGNIDFALDFIKTRMPQVKVCRPEGTYMLWLDFSGCGLSSSEIHHRIYLDANVILQDGVVHDPEEGACFQRMCIALPRTRLETALERIAAVL
jgi:cystathionine beta-lyase